jgi:hypothetical protein
VAHSVSGVGFKKLSVPKARGETNLPVRAKGRYCMTSFWQENAFCAEDGNSI